MSTSTQKRGRGISKGFKGWENGEILELDFNDHMQPIGPNASIFVTQLGILARCGSRLPLNLISWAKMPSSNRDTLWQEIKENTNAPEEYKDTCLMKVGDIWEKWKAEVKKMYFTPYEDDPEKLAEFPGDNRLRPDQWKDLVEYWQLEEVKTQSQENKEHREELEHIHRTGRISFANIRYGMEQMKEDVSRVSVFLKTRQCPTNKRRHEDTEEVVEQMKKKLKEVPESELTEKVKEAIFIETLGCEKGHGRSSSPCSNRIQKLIEEKVQMMMSEYEKQHKEKMEKLDDLGKQQKEKLENFDLIVQKYRTEMVRHGIPDRTMTPLNPSSVWQVTTDGSVMGLDTLSPNTPHSHIGEDEDIENMTFGVYSTFGGLVLFVNFLKTHQDLFFNLDRYCKGKILVIACYTLQKF